MSWQSVEALLAANAQCKDKAASNTNLEIMYDVRRYSKLYCRASLNIVITHEIVKQLKEGGGEIKREREREERGILESFKSGGWRLESLYHKIFFQWAEMCGKCGRVQTAEDLAEWVWQEGEVTRSAVRALAAAVSDEKSVLERATEWYTYPRYRDTDKLLSSIVFYIMCNQ